MASLGVCLVVAIVIENRLVVGLCGYWLIFFKLQDSAFTMLPAENTHLAGTDYDVFNTMIILCFIGMLFRVRVWCPHSAGAIAPCNAHHLTFNGLAVVMVVCFVLPCLCFICGGVVVSLFCCGPRADW